MKSIIHIIFFFFYFLSLQAQERVTSIQEGNNTQIDTYFEVGGKKYVANVYKGFLRLYEWKAGKADLIEAFEGFNTYYGYGDFAKPVFTGHHLLAEGFNHFIVYDLESRNYSKFEKIKGFRYYQFKHFDKDKAILSATHIDGPYQKYFELNFESGFSIIEPSLGSVAATNGDYHVFHSWADNGATLSKYTFVNTKTGSKVVLVEASVKQLNFYIEDNVVWYYNEQTIASSYNIDSQVFDQYENLVLRSDLSTYKLHRQDSLLISVASGNLKYNIVVYNLNTRTIVNNFYEGGNSIDLIHYENVNFFERYLVVNTYYSKLLRYEYLSGDKTIYEATVGFDFNVSPGYLRLDKRNVQYFKEKLIVIDFDTKQIEKYDYSPPLDTQFNYRRFSYRNSSIIEETDDYVLVSFEMDFTVYHFNQLKINKKTKIVEELNIINLNRGLSEQALLYTVKDNLYLHGENLYHIKGAKSERINKLPLINSYGTDQYLPIVVDNNHLQYYCRMNNAILVYTYDGCENKEVDVLSDGINLNWIYQNGRFYYTWQSEMYVKYKNEIRKLGHTTMQSFYGYMQMGDYFYYFDGQKVFEYDGNDVREVGSVEGDIYGIVMVNDIAYVKGTYIYRIADTGLVKIENFENRSITTILKNKNNRPDLVMNNTGFGYFENDTYYAINKDSFIYINEDHSMALMRKRENATLIDLRTFELTPLPKLAQGRYVGLSIVGNDTLLFSVEKYYTTANVYKLKNKTETALLATYDNIYPMSYYFIAAGVGTSKIFMVGNILIRRESFKRMYQLGQLNFPMPNSYKLTMAYHKGHVYYFDNDAAYGRQLYRYSIEDDIYIGPNKKPFDFTLKATLTRDRIQVMSATEADIDFAYTIYDTSGRSISTGRLSNEAIDVSSLSNGMYLIQLLAPTGHGSLKFVKM
jgi:hypothetical protein